MNALIVRAGTRAAERRLAQLDGRGGSAGSAIERQVAAIIAAVRRDGDRALLRFTARFDGVTRAARTLGATPTMMAAAYARVPRRVQQDLALAAVKGPNAVRGQGEIALD